MQKTVTRAGTFETKLKIELVEGGDPNNCSKELKVRAKATLMTTGSYREVTNYPVTRDQCLTPGHPIYPTEGIFDKMQFGNPVPFSKEVTATIDVTLSIDQKGNIVATGGTDQIENEADQRIENIEAGNDVRIRTVRARVKIWSEGINNGKLRISAEGMIFHMFDGYTLGWTVNGVRNDMQVKGRIQCDQNVEQHDKWKIPENSSFPFSRDFEIRGPYRMAADGTC